MTNMSLDFRNPDTGSLGEQLVARPVLGVGAPGKQGYLRAELAPNGGRTRATRVEQRVPLHVGRVAYPEPEWPALAHLMLTMPTGGFVQGDRVEVDLLVRPGAAAHVTSQSASRAYRCEAGEIRQELRLAVLGDGYLEWWPDPLIPYAGTHFRQTTHLTVDPRATLLFADSLLAGRVARGERHAYGSLDLTTTIARPDGAAFARDHLHLAPARRPPAALGLLGPATALGTYFLLGPALADALESPLADALSDAAPGRAAVTRLPADTGLLVRSLTPDSAALKAVQETILATARRVLRGLGPPQSSKL